MGLLASVAVCLLAPALLAKLLPDRTHLVRDTSSEDEVTLSWQALTPPPEARHFVEANPEAPDNPPDDTPNFSFRDQQAAQPEQSASDEQNEAPRTGGDLRKDSQKVVEGGDPDQSVPPLPVLPADSELAKDFEHGSPVGEDDEKADPPTSPTDIPAPLDEGGTAVRKVEAKGRDPEHKRPLVLTELPATATNEAQTIPPEPKPLPRRRLAPDLVRGPLMKTVANAPRIGRVAIECRLHPYGAYVQEMLQAIEDQWHLLSRGSRDFLGAERLPPKITLRFTLVPSGRIHSMRRLDKEGNSVASEICLQSIKSRTPFGRWTEEMIRDFGEGDVVTINFLYR